MWNIIVKNKYLFIAYFIIWIVAFTFILNEGKINSHLSVNEFHSQFLDSFFKIITNLGDGIFMVMFGCILILFLSFRYGFVFLSSFLCSSLIVQFLKRFIFPDFDRPILFFNKLGIEIYKIPGVEYYSHFSFPSGHSTTAFALFIGLSLFLRNIPIKFLFLILAWITAFSRVYLSQHFFEDILAGSILGTITVLFMYFLFYRWNESWLDKNALQLIRKKK